MTRRALAILFFVLISTTGFAQDSARLSNIEQAWGDWLANQKVANASLAIAYRGKVVHVANRGNAANRAAPVASLSKAITGACIRQIASTGKLKINTKLREIPGFSVTYDLGQSDLGDITIGQLITHTSGLKPDSTQRTMARWLGGSRPRHAEVAKSVFQRRYRRAGQGKHFYNNENYAILGLVIEAVTGRSYAGYCSNAVLKPFGAKGRLSGKYGALGAWGGWELTTANYLKFVSGNFGPTSAIGRSPSKWASKSVGGGAYYGMGTYFRKSGKGYNFWHFGLHCFGRSGTAGAYFASWQGDWSVALTYQHCPGSVASNKLDAALWKASNQ